MMPLDLTTLPGFRPLLASETVEDVLRQAGAWPAVPGLDEAPRSIFKP